MISTSAKAEAIRALNCAKVSSLCTSIVAFSPLAQGLLTDRYLKGIPNDSRIKKDGRFLKEDMLISKYDQITKLAKIAERRKQSLADMALAWVLKDENITSCIVGASSKEQILDDLKVLDSLSFTADELKEIDDISL